MENRFTYSFIEGAGGGGDIRDITIGRLSAAGKPVHSLRDTGEIYGADADILG